MHASAKYLFLPAFTLLMIFSYAQKAPLPAKEKKGFTTKQKWIIGGLALQQAGSLYLEYKWWWKHDYHSFTIKEDGAFNNYSLGIDKVGHFYISYLYFTTLNEMMRWGEFSDRSRIIASAGLPLLWAASIELGDGFSSFGFSFSDLLANTLGIGYGVLQDRVPYMRNFNFKFSYYPSRAYLDNHFKDWSLSSDYNGHIYWLSFNVHNLLPGASKRAWPEWLNLAAGYGISSFPQNNMKRELMIGFDYNLGAIRTKNKAVDAFRNVLDKVHFPAPGLKRTGKGDITPKWLILN